MKTEIYSTKNIALIDEDLTLYSELEEQKDFHKQYVWKYFNNIDDFNQTFRENFINLMIFNEPRTGCNNIELLFKPFLDLSQNSIIVLSSNKDMKETNINYSERSKIIFIRKPIKFLFLMKVIREKFNSLKVSRVLNINIGSYLLKPFEKVLIDKFQQKILLTDTEVKILKILCSYAGRFVAKEIILDATLTPEQFSIPCKPGDELTSKINGPLFDLIKSTPAIVRPRILAALIAI